MSNYYAQTDTTPIFPVGRNITLTANVMNGNAPAYGVVTFSYVVNGKTPPSVPSISIPAAWLPSPCPPLPR